MECMRAKREHTNAMPSVSSNKIRFQIPRTSFWINNENIQYRSHCDTWHKEIDIDRTSCRFTCAGLTCVETYPMSVKWVWYNIKYWWSWVLGGMPWWGIQEARTYMGRYVTERMVSRYTAAISPSVGYSLKQRVVIKWRYRLVESLVID